MQVLHPRCAGLDVHKDTVVAAVRLAEPGGVRTEVRRFDTTTPGLLALGHWLAECGCTHAVMEATGVYWKPVWHVLSDGELALVLANAAHVKNVPGRKTDVADAAWLADLLAHGLVRASFVPDAPTQVVGETDPERLLALVHCRVKAEPAQLRAALSGRVGNSHRFLLRLHLGQYDALAKALEEIDAEVERNLDPFRDAVRLLRTVPGIGDLAARAIVAEIGSDMRRFPTAAHLVSWAGLCPRNDESAGKRRSTRLRKGAPWLKTTLVQCAWAASRRKGGYLRAQFQRLRQRRGPKKAVCAVAASILTAIWHILRDGAVYQDLGADHFHKRSPEQQVQHLARQIAKLGFACSITPKPESVSA